MNKVIFLVILIAALVISACNNEGINGNMPVSAQIDNEQVQDTQDNSQPSSQDTLQSPGSSPPKVTLDLNTYLQNSQSISYRANYILKSGFDDMVFTFEVVEYNSHGKKRTDTLSNGKELRAYTDDNTFYQCSNTNGWKCYSVSQDNGDGTATIDAQKYEISDLPDRQIAGATAKCFEVNADVKLIYCFSPEGVPLYTFVNSTKGFSEVSASSYSTQVDDSVFELPATATVAQQSVFLNNKNGTVNSSK